MMFRPSSTPTITEWTGAVVLVSLAWLAYALPWINGTVTVPWDAKAHFQPQLQFLAQSLHGGQSPFWTPDVFSGWPQIADPQSLIFSPFHLLLAAINGNPSFAAADAVALGSLLWGAIGLMAHGRDRGWHPAGLIVAALVFMMGGSASARLQHTGQILSLSVWPWALWALARVLQAPGWQRGAVAGVFVAWLAIGRDQVAFLALMHLSAFVLWHLAADRDPAVPRSRRLSALGLTVVVTLALAAVPVLLTLPLLAASNRPAIDFVMSARSSLPPAFGFVALIPDLYGSLGPAAGYWGPASDVWGDPMLWTDRASGHVYFGALTALLILGHGLLGRRLLERSIRFDALAALAFGIYAVGWYTPVYQVLFNHVPGIDLFRRPADATFHVGFTLALLAGHLAHRAATEGPPRLGGLARPAALWMVVGVIGGAMLVAHTHHRLDAALPPLLRALAWMGLAGAALWWTGRLAPSSRTALASIVLALPLAVDLVVHHGTNEMNALPPSTYDALRRDTSNTVIQALKVRVEAGRTETRRDRVEMVGLGFDVPNTGLVHGLEHILGYNPLRLRDYQSAVGAEDDVAIWQMRHFTKAMPGYQSPVSNLLGLRWIASSVPLQTIDRRFDPQRWPAPQRLAEGWLYENPNALPRVLRTDRVRAIDPARLIVDGDWPTDWDPTRTVLLPAVPQGLAEAGADAPPSSGAGSPSGPTTSPSLRPGRTGLTRYEHTRIDIQTEAPTAGVVLLNDVWHPWWQAEVDGRPTPILRANGLMRAVQVPAGASHIVFRFRPFEGAWRELTHRLPSPVWVSPNRP